LPVGVLGHEFSGKLTKISYFESKFSEVAENRMAAVWKLSEKVPILSRERMSKSRRNTRTR
jgi:hypothetical protein